MTAGRPGAEAPAAAPAPGAVPEADARAAGDAPAPPDEPMACVLRALADPVPPSSDLDLTPGAPPLRGLGRTPAAVLLALQPGPRGPEVVLTRRSARLRHHPGQIALPGGKLDPTDRDAEAGALREAQEEIGLDPARVELLGRLSPHRTATGFSITPVVGRLRAPFRPIPEAGEVAEVFAVPLAHLIEPARYRLERRLWQGGWRNYYVVPWGPYYIWGATARILHGLALRSRP